MPRRTPAGQRLDTFRLAIAERCTMAEAAARIAAREEATRIDTARKAHGEAMRRLFAKGYGRR